MKSGRLKLSVLSLFFEEFSSTKRNLCFDILGFFLTLIRIQSKFSIF